MVPMKQQVLAVALTRCLPWGYSVDQSHQTIVGVIGSRAGWRMWIQKKNYKRKEVPILIKNRQKLENIDKSIS